MRNRLSTFALSAGIAGSAASVAVAALLGILPNAPIIETFPSGPVDAGVGITSYSIVNDPTPGIDPYGLFSANSNAAILWMSGPSGPLDPILPTGLSPTGFIMTLDFWVRQSDGAFVDGRPGQDFQLWGKVTIDGIPYEGKLLAGEVSGFGFQDEGANALFDFRITPVDGLLTTNGLPWTGMDIGIILLSENSSFSNTFTGGFIGNAKATIGVLNPPVGGGPSGGCTPGFWKQPHHACHYPAPYLPSTPFKSVFGNCTRIPGNPTLVEALRLNGGGINALMRHSAAALLNAAHPGFNPAPAFDTIPEVIAAFQAACNSGNYEDTKNLMEASNEIGCPIGGNCNN